MSLRLGVVVIQMSVGIGALLCGLYIGGMKDLWWAAIIGLALYIFGMILPLALTGKGT